MKKLFLSALAVFACLSSFAQTQGDDNGFGLRFDVGLRGNKYGAYQGLGMSSTTENVSFVDHSKKVYPIKEFEKGARSTVTNVPMFGMTLDNRWYVGNPGNFGIAISARWLDVSMGALNYEVDGKMVKHELDAKIDFTGPGVIGTYYLGNEKAIDAYYQFAPSIGIIGESNYDSDGNQIEDSWKGNAEFGWSHYFGGAFRYKIFQFGFEYNIAKMAGISLFSDDESDSNGVEIESSRRNTMRIFAGFKF